MTGLIQLKMVKKKIFFFLWDHCKEKYAFIDILLVVESVTDDGKKPFWHVSLLLSVVKSFSF